MPRSKGARIRVRLGSKVLSRNESRPVQKSDRPENVGENWLCYVQASEGFGEMSPGPGASSSVALGLSFGIVVPPLGVPLLTAGV